MDWPKSERDGYVFTEINTVVNAFHLAALARMAVMADAVGNAADAADCRARFAKGQAEFQRQLFDTKRGLYRDGVGTDHCSHHASLFQYGGDSKAIELMTVENDRSWRHMVASGTTITWEAWDQKYKPNQDWNHARCTPPANLLPRFVLGVEPLEAGWARAIIRPCPGGLRFARGKVPTPRGPIEVHWKRDGGFQLEARLPEQVSAEVEVPAGAATEQVFVNGARVDAKRKGDHWILPDDISGDATIEVR